MFNAFVKKNYKEAKRIDTKLKKLNNLLFVVGSYVWTLSNPDTS